MIQVLMNKYKATLNFVIFPGGEEHVTIKRPTAVDPDEVVVIVRPINAQVRERLDLVVDAIRNMFVGCKYTLVIHFQYLPFARQDRVANYGECFSLKKYAERINALKADAVIVDDCHSDVGTALINNVVNRPLQEHILENSELYNRFKAQDVVLLSPDAGAIKSTNKLAASFGGLPVIGADKIRDTKTGNITGTRLNFSPETVNGKEVFIVDDICDGGRTFIEIAKQMEAEGCKPASLRLVVTHGIFSKGREPLEEYFDEVIAIHDWTKEG